MGVVDCEGVGVQLPSLSMKVFWDDFNGLEILLDLSGLDERI